MDEQRLQEIEARNGVGEEYLRGIGYTDSADILALVAEVRRLRADVLQQQAEKVEVVTRITEQRDVACDDSDRFREVCVDVGRVINALGKDIASLPSLVLDVVRERDAALAERDALRDAICPGWQEKGLADKLVALARAFRSDSETMDEIGEDFDGSYRQAVIERDALRADLDRAKMEVVRFKAERDAALQWRSPSAAQALTEARRVLGRIEWVRIGGKMQPYCPFCWEQAKDGHAADCALAVVLAQEEQ